MIRPKNFAWGLAVLLASPALAQVTQRVSVDSNGAQANDYSHYIPAISADGRWVAFLSSATNLVPGDTNASADIFVHDRLTGATERVSVDSSGVPANGDNGFPAISADGRFVAFTSFSTNLVPADTNGEPDVFVHDRLTGATERVSVASDGAQGNRGSQRGSISADGRFVVFRSSATNLIPDDTTVTEDIYLHDRQAGTTEIVSVSTAGVHANTTSWSAVISGDGRTVAFQSYASNLVLDDTNADADVFVRDLQAGTTERVSVGLGGVEGNDDADSPAISFDGRIVAFMSRATNLVPDDTNLRWDIFVRDRQDGTFARVSVDTGGIEANEDSRYPELSADGRFVAFGSYATNLVPNDTNNFDDVFVRDRQSGQLERVSVNSSGVEGDRFSAFPAVSATGRFVAFRSQAHNLVPNDTNNVHDIFVHDREASGFTSLCHPGLDGVIGCPCANPPGVPGRGCDNSSGTGGALLSASGVAYLSTDSLVFSTSGEKPTALSIVLQGDAPIPSGAVFGQGVRCAGGSLKRLYTKNAIGGIVTAPDFGAGEPQVSVRSAALGDTIMPGDSRWYLVYYRDPVVLGGCPATSTFNATQTGRVDWSF